MNCDNVSRVSFFFFVPFFGKISLDSIHFRYWKVEVIQVHANSEPFHDTINVSNE